MSRGKRIRGNCIIIKGLFDHRCLEKTQPDAPQCVVLAVSDRRIVRIAAQNFKHLPSSEDAPMWKRTSDLDKKSQNAIPIPWANMNIQKFVLRRHSIHTSCSD